MESHGKGAIPIAYGTAPFYSGKLFVKYLIPKQNICIMQPISFVTRVAVEISIFFYSLTW
jgi:hypothetical protein